ncbi:hypothetical protein [Streptomyces sp. NPDC057877]|uniref:hypothetical protein n=1 Tax=Streptomyces sp. NPDC057877 TaxID=3346269 RepID=UPI0036C521B8
MSAGTPAVPRPRTTPGWARPAPVDQLADELAEFLAAAVHPDEIAALLEADGLTDERIRERYGVRDSFALAEQLYARADRRRPEPDGPLHDPWRTGLLGCLLRGVVFALPGLAHILGAPLHPTATAPLLAGALTSWTWNQGLAHRAYSWLGLGDRAAARRCLLRGGPAGALLGTLTVFAAAGTADPAVLAVAAGQSCYLGAATALLVLGRERALLAALLPLAAGALATQLTAVSEPARLLLLLGSLTAVTVLAVRAVVPAPRRPGEGWTAGLTALLPFGALGAPVRRRPDRAAPRLAASLPYAVLGLGSGVLILHTALGDGRPVGAVALTLSMGPAEWLLYRFRSGSLAGLRSTSTPRAFWRATARTVLACLTAYLAALLTLTLATTALWPHHPAPALSAARLTGLLLLGVVLWTGLLLQSFGAVAGAAVVCAAAALAQTAVLTTGAPPWTGLAVHGTAAVVLTALVCVLLGRATAHR